MSHGTQLVRLDYTNWRGIRKTYIILPLRLQYTSNQWHNLQWLLVALDVEKQRVSTFSLKTVHSWTPIIGGLAELDLDSINHQAWTNYEI